MRSGEFSDLSQFPARIVGEARLRWGDPLAYEQGLLYMFQACRRGGWWFQHDEFGLLLIARDYCGAGCHSVVSPITGAPLALIDAARRDSWFATIKPINIRHIPLDLVDGQTLPDYLSRSEIDSLSVVPSLEDVSEDQYPQVIGVLGDHWTRSERMRDTLAPVLPRGSGYSELRYQVRRFLRSIVGSGKSGSIVSLAQARWPAIATGLDRWMEGLKARYEQPGRPIVEDYDSTFRAPVEAVIEAVKTHLAAGGIGELLVLDESAIGGWAGGWVSDQCFGVNVLFADTRVRGASEFIMYRSALYALLASFRYLNLGGAEFLSLYNFKEKIAPVEEGGLRRGLTEMSLNW